MAGRKIHRTTRGLWRSLLLMCLFLPFTAHAYDVILPDQTVYPVYLDFSLEPKDAWEYEIREIWFDTYQHFKDVDEKTLTQQGVITWEPLNRSLRLDAPVETAISSSPLTVIIEAKTTSLVSLIPVTVHSSAEKLSEKPTVTADYPHIIQSYQSKQTCYNPTIWPDLPSVKNLLPAFVRNSVSSVRISANPDLAIKRTKNEDFHFWLQRRVCVSASSPQYYALSVEYQTAGRQYPGVQTMELVFSTSNVTVTSDGNGSTRKTKHKQRKHRRAANGFAFPESLYSAQIVEEQQPPVNVMKINIASNKPVTYSMLALMDSRSQAFFSIDAKSGLVRTEALLDRETIAQHYFRITAVAEMDRLQTATTTLNIKVLDANDNTPTFEKTDYEVSVSESAMVGSVVVTVHARDEDEGENGQVTYSLINPKGKNDAFQIDGKTGVITTRVPLDREQLEEHVLYVKAEDEGRDQHKKSSIAKVIIKILDENDNTPSITSNHSCNLEVREDIDWSALPTIAQLHAEDGDAGLNGQVRYSIIGGNSGGQFIVDAVTGDLKVAAPLDYEAERKYRLLIRTQDLGSPPRSNTTVCVINILDMNDNEPKFSTSLYQTNIAEDAHVGYPVVQLRAYDSDEGPKGKIVYAIKNQSSSMEQLPFVIDPDSGWITTSMRLDRERKDKYDFTVEAHDLGVPSRTSTASVQITVLDVNDNGPVFEQRDYNVSISEGALQGTQIVTVRASDKDLNARLTYQIVKGNEENCFSIINQNGMGLILLTKSINYRRAQLVELVVEVADESGKNDRVRVTVHILAANLHRPTFLNAPFRIQIPENIPTGTSVIELKALDDDVGENGRITYAMGTDSAITEFFQLDPVTGALKVKKPLDREAHSTFAIPVTASDHGAPALYDMTDVLVELVDANDNAPVFSQKSYFVAVKEDVSPYTSITQVSAVDPDFGLNGLVRYTFEGGNSGNGTFSIDAALGIIRTTKPLDREMHSAYELIVAAVDRGEPSLSSTVIVQVKILDINDNAPVFASDILNFYAPENLTIGSTVAEILASDPDEGPNSVIEYSIISGPDADSFALVTRPDHPPLLSNLIELDHESPKKQYRLVIRASSPPLQTDVTVNIFVTDINDNAPILKDFRIVLNNYPRHFPHGVIGKVPVTDRDATAKLEYKILSGNKHSLLSINPSNGDIQLSSALNSDIAYSATFTIQVSDGLNVVSSTCTLKTIPVDHRMLTNSMTFRVANLTARDLLNLNSYDRLVEGLAYISLCPPDGIYVFSILDEADSVNPVLNVTFAAKKSVQGRDYVAPDVLRERLYLLKDTFYNMTRMQVLPFEDSLCLREPCPNFEKCTNVQKFHKVGRFVATESLFFRSVQPIPAFDCECPTGYTGMSVHYTCDTEINLCYSNPCGTNGNCIATEGGYHCLCQPGFTGTQCEVELRTAECSDGFCKDPATCIHSTNQSPECTGCPQDGHRTSLCELRTRSFYGNTSSYLVFPGIKTRNRFTLSLNVATVKRSGLIAYNGRFTENSDYFALELVNGSARFSFSLGQERRSAVVPKLVSDGHWHKLAVEYFNKSAKLTVDDCDEILSWKHGNELDYHCAAVATEFLDPHCANVGAMCYRFLDVTGPLYLGGVPENFVETRLSVGQFDGCIRDFELDGKFVDMNSFIEQRDSAEGCLPRNDHCRSHGPSCSSGTCVNGWGTSSCNCLPGCTGKNCAKDTGEVFQLEGDGHMVFQASASPGSFEISFEFRTAKESGTLLKIKAGMAVVMNITMSRQFLRVNSGSGKIYEGETAASTGTWHRLDVAATDVETIVKLDGAVEARIARAPIQKEAVVFVIGGHEEPSHPNGFAGCMKELRYSGKKFSPSFRSNVREGCGGQPALCTRETCAGKSRECVDNDGSTQCQCKKGFIGKTCQDICTFDPCKNGICVHAPEKVNGYECRCFANFTGKYCDEKAQETCPAAWWGSPVCGPCKCDVTKGFDPRCDKRNGRCFCKENYYLPPGSDRCIECGCYPRGSISNECDNTGQCTCRSGVSGLRCDICSDEFAEVTEEGCEVVYGACPQAFAGDIWWDRTSYGHIAIQSCPRSGLGKAFRTCDEATKTWMSPDLKNCTSLPLEVASELWRDNKSGTLAVNTFVAVRIVSELRNGLNLTLTDGSLMEHDLKISCDLLTAVLEHEVAQNGMNLTHRLDKNFLPELLDSVSQLLSTRNIPAWRSLRVSEKTEQPTALIGLFLDYVKTIAKEFTETHMDPFEIITKNFKLGINTNLPDNENLIAQLSVSHPIALPLTRIQIEIPDNALMFYAEFADLPNVLSSTMNTSKSVRPVSRGFFYGTVPASSAVTTYEFEIVRRKFMGSPQCVRWDFSSGNWMTNDCTTGTVNATHVNCSCLPEVLVAVITESTALVNLFRLGLPVFLFNIVVLILAAVLNMVSAILLLATRSTSDTICIYENVVLMALAGDLVFLLAADVTWGLFLCKILAVLLHFVFLSRMCWCLAQGINVYRSVQDGKEPHGRIRLYFVLGYALPAAVIALAVGLHPDGYGTEEFCWMALDNHLILSLAIPVMGIILIALLMLAFSQCLLHARKKPSIQAYTVKLIRGNLYVCAGLSLIFVTVFVLAVLAVSLYLPVLGFVYPASALAQSVYILIFLCLRTPEVKSLMDEKFVRFLRRKLDTLTSNGKPSKMNNNVCETYRNPGISISDSTTYHRTTRPDKDISCDFTRSRSDTSVGRVQQGGGSLAEMITAKYPDSQKESEGTNEETISVRSSTLTSPRENTNGDIFITRECDSEDECTAFRNPGLPSNVYRPHSSAASFGATLPSWNPALSQIVKTGSRSPTCFTNPINEFPSPKQLSTFGTFRPASKASHNGNHLIDTVTGRILGQTDLEETDGFSEPIPIPPPEPFRNTNGVLIRRMNNLPDVINCEGGTAV